MAMKIKASLYVVLLFWGTCATSIDSNDLMSGEGLFLGSSVAAYQLDHSHTTSFISWNGSHILRLEKSQGQQVSYEKGLSYAFSPTKITHVQFKFASSNLQIEDSNLRITDENQKTLVLFRAGRSGLIRVNQKQMISFYNQSVSNDSDIKLTQMDLVINWESKIIEIFINNKFKEKCNFFDSSVEPVAKVLLYNLYPSVSYWSDLVICSNRCYSFSFQSFSTFLGSMALLILAIIN